MFIELCYTAAMEKTKNYQQREWLIEHYLNQGLSLAECARISGYPVAGSSIAYFLHKHGIPTRPVAHHLRGQSNPMYGKHHSESTRQKIKQAKTGISRSFESRIKQSKSIHGTNNHRYGKERGHGQGTWVVLSGSEPIYMRSRWEVFFADWLCQQGREWIYEPQAFLLLNGSIYTPDFLSEGIYYEVKGWYNQEDQEKVTGFHRAYPDLTLKVIDKAALKELGIDVERHQYTPSCLTLADSLIRVCPTCNRTFIPARKKTKFCSYACRKRPRKLSVQKNCEVCGALMWVYPSQVEKKKACSYVCGRVLSAKSHSGDKHWSRRHQG